MQSSNNMAGMNAASLQEMQQRLQQLQQQQQQNPQQAFRPQQQQQAAMWGHLFQLVSTHSSLLPFSSSSVRV